jgi:tellurite resistance protein
MAETPIRGLRVDEETWTAALERAQREHRTLSDVMRVALRAYADGSYDAQEKVRRK